MNRKTAKGMSKGKALCMKDADPAPISAYGDYGIFSALYVRRRASEASKRAVRTKTRSEATTIIVLTSNSLQ